MFLAQFPHVLGDAFLVGPQTLSAIGALVVPYYLLISVLHLTFAIAVWADGNHCKTAFGRGPFLVPCFVWALVTLLGGLPAVAVYWVIHHSSLRMPSPFHREEAAPKGDPVTL